MQKTEELLVAVNNLVNNDGEITTSGHEDVDDLIMRASDLARFAVAETRGELRDILLSISKASADLAEWCNVNWKVSEEE